MDIATNLCQLKQLLAINPSEWKVPEWTMAGFVISSFIIVILLTIYLWSDKE